MKGRRFCGIMIGIFIPPNQSFEGTFTFNKWEKITLNGSINTLK
jgi:hypothetical protein